MLRQNRRYAYTALIVVIVLLAIGGVYLTVVYQPDCQNYECWQKYMSRCSSATFINEEPEASWGYTVEGAKGEQCEITVKLLQAKQGELGIDKIVGHEMTCYYPKGYSGYAEKDLSKCTGILKEDLQGIVINKLHSYILENLGKFNETLSKI